MSTAFAARTSCIATQYGRFRIDSGEFVNGNLTLGENIADNGGIKLSHAAWRAAATTNEQRLPGLPALSPEQLFFVSFAQSWCGTTRPAAAHLQVLTDPHSPGRFRVNGVVMNMRAFARAFQCAQGTAMNPRAEERCEVW